MTLPNELIISILEYLPLHELRSKTAFVSFQWQYCSAKVIKERLAGLSNLLHEFGSSIEDTDKLKSVFESEKPLIQEKEPFTAWLLANFDHSPESQVVTGIQLALTGINEKTGMLTFSPIGKSNFGMFINELGYIPITTPYDMNYFSFARNMFPTVRFWFHVASSVPNSHILRDCNSEQPISKEGLQKEAGVYSVSLNDNIGSVGTLTYKIYGVKPRPNQSMTTDIIGGPLIEFLEQQDQKIVGQVLTLELNPQTLVAFPL